MPPASDSILKHVKEELASFIELLYWRNGTVPTVKEINNSFDLSLTEAQYQSFLENPKIKDYLVNKRNVPLEATARLTAKQLDWIKVVTDATDPRPVALKMKETGVSRADLTKWHTDLFFQQVMYEQSTRSFQSARHGVLRALAIEAMGGNVSAMKIYLQMTGDFQEQSSSKVEVQVTHELRQTINVVLDILQRHCTPEVIDAVATEIERATIPGLPSAAPIELPMPVVDPRTITPKLPARSAGPVAPRKPPFPPKLEHDLEFNPDDW